MSDIDSALDEVRHRLRRYPAERYPVQHGTARLRQGTLLAHAERADEAVEALEAAVGLLAREHLPLEHARALNMLGIAQRMAGRPSEASAAFERAAAAFARAAAAFAGAEAPTEQAAAIHNLGLVGVDRGDNVEAARRFAEAQAAFEDAGALTQAGASARERGAALLAVGEAERAASALEAAVELARRGNDPAGLGAASNALGLARLALGRPEAAREALADAIGANPRGLRPEAYAMAQANLALAHEASGDLARARFGARLALGVPDAPEPVRAQAAEAVERLGGGPGDIVAVLADEPPEQWVLRWREELARWVDADESERKASAAAWVAEVAARGDAADRLHAWVLAALELPPDRMERCLEAVVAAAGASPEAEREAVRGAFRSALVRLHPPQWMRVRDRLDALAARHGLPEGWG